MPHSHSRSGRPIALWLLTGVFMIIVQIILGGITRLTDSGLSITEWKPLLGTIPPLNEKQWQEAFDQYKQIAQFKHLHAYFTLEDFKSIFFWEWLHRVWGRLIGVVFLIPFLIFLFRGQFRKDMVRPMVILFLLGGLQGLIGWIMVKSGLNDENLYVSHIRLAIHFIAALVLLVFTFWFALRLLLPARTFGHAGNGQRLLVIIFICFTLQLVYGAFMAGLKAATYAPTWPTINGEYLPANMGRTAGKSFAFASALVNDPITIHFIHRNLAYLLFVLLVVWTVRTAKQKTDLLFNRVKYGPLLLALVQVGLGIAAVLTSPQKVPRKWGVFEWNAQLHQFVALLLLLALVLVFYLNRRQQNANSPGSFEPQKI